MTQPFPPFSTPRPAFFDAGDKSQADLLQEKAGMAAAEPRTLASRQKAEVALLNFPEPR